MSDLITVKEVNKAVRKCKLCKHEYLKPCDGKNPVCMNAIWVNEGKNLKRYKKAYEQALATHGTSSANKSKRKTRLVSEPSSKAKRVRL